MQSWEVSSEFQLVNAQIIEMSFHVNITSSQCFCMADFFVIQLIT